MLNDVMWKMLLESNIVPLNIVDERDRHIGMEGWEWVVETEGQRGRGGEAETDRDGETER